MRKILVVLAILCVALGTARLGDAQFNEPAHTDMIPAGDLIPPEALRQMLQSIHPPIVFQVGSHLFFTEAHITGSTYAGPGSQEQGLESLEQTVAHLPKNNLIVLYCGCCPWNRCPNVGPAWKRLHDLGYSNVKVLYLAHNFGDDWVAKGYPTERQ